jgi:hypothetical protein
VTLVILYSFSVWYVCKLDSYAHILWAFSLTLKLGMTPHGSHVRQPSVKSLLSLNWAPVSGMKSWSSTIVRPGCHPGLPHSSYDQPPWSREARFNKVVTRLLGLRGPTKPDMLSVHIKACHRGQNNVILSRHRRGLPPWNPRIATTLSPPFPSECSTFP